MRTIFALSVFLFCHSSVLAQSSTWIAVNSGTWSNGVNWNGGVPPVSGPTTELEFPMPVFAYSANNDNPGTFILRLLTIGADAGNGGQISGNPIQFAGSNPGIVVNGARSATLSTTSIDLLGATSVTGTSWSGRLTINRPIIGNGSLFIDRVTTNFLGSLELSSATANSFGGGVTLQAGRLSVSQGANVGAGTLTIGTVGAGFNSTGDLRASAAATFNVPVMVNNGATLNMVTGSQLNFGQAINGLGGVSVGTPMTSVPTVIEGNSGYSGRTDLVFSTMTLRGTTGALSGSTLIEAINGSTLALDSNAATTGMGNTAGNQSAQNRIRDDAVLNFYRSRLDLIANTGAGTTETLGTFNGNGWNIFRLTPQTNSGAALTVGNLNRSERGSFEFRAANLGANAPGTANSSNILLTQIDGASPSSWLVGGGGSVGTTTIGILPFATGSTAAGSSGNTFVTYGANGVRTLNATTEFAAALQDVPYASESFNNVNLASTQILASQPVTSNSLLMTSSGSVYGFGGLTGRLNVSSGAMLSATAATLGIAEVGFAGREAVLTGNMLVHSAIVNANGLTLAGEFGAPTLLSPSNSIGGPIAVNAAALTVNSQSQLGGSTALNLHGGAIRVGVLATGMPEVFTLPVNVSPAGGRISPFTFGGFSAGSHVELAGPITGSGALQVSGNGTLTLSGDNSAFAGMWAVNNGVLRFDAPSRLGTNPAVSLGSAAAFSIPGALHPTATMTLNKNLYLAAGFGEVHVDAGVTVTQTGFVTGLEPTSAAEFRKMGAGEWILTREATHFGATVVGDRTGARLNVGGTLTLRDQGAILNTGSAVGVPPNEFVVNGGSSLIADNTGTANLFNRLSQANMELGGGALILRGSPSAASSEIVGGLRLAADTGSLIEVAPGAGQTAALFFNDQSNAFTRNGGSTVVLRGPNLGGTGPGAGQINFVPNLAGTLTNGILAGAFGEDNGASPSTGFITFDTIPATSSFPAYFRSRLLTPGEYTLNSFPDTGIVTTNHRQTVPASPTGSPRVNSLYLDTGGSLAIGAGNTVTLTSGNLLMANGTSVTGSSGFLAPFGHLSVYVGSGSTATLGANVAVPNSTFIVAKAGDGTLDLTTAITGAAAPTRYAIQRGTFRLGSGGSIPATSNVNVEAGATFEVNGSGLPIDLATLNGLGTVQLGANAATVLRLSPGAGVTSLFGGTITGSGSLEKAGAGILQLAPTANYSGAINLAGGTLRFGGDSVDSPAVPIVSGGVITAADGTTIFARNVRDFQRSIDVNQGASAGNVTLSTESGGLMKVSGGINLGTNKTLSVGASTNGMIRLSGAITGNGNVSYSMGTGGTASRAIVEGNNSYSGTTTVGTSGMIGIGSDTAFGNGGAVSITSAASFVAMNDHRTISNPIQLNANLTFGTNDAIYQGFNLTFAGPVAMNASRTITTTAAGRLTLTNVSGTGFDLTKAGGGSLALAGPNNTYSGVTNVNAGALLVNGTLTAGGGAVNVAAGAWLGGNGTINRPIALNSGSTIAPGESPGQLTVGGSVTMSSGSRYFWELNGLTTAGGGTNWDRLAMTSGELNVVSGAVLIPAFIGSATSPNIGDLFWQSTQRWDNIIDLTGSATNNSGLTAFTIDNSAWSAFGTFTTIPATVGNGVALLWTPVPEPLFVLTLCALAGGGAQYWRRRLKPNMHGS